MPDLKKLIIVGAGGFGPEFIWVAENLNAHNPTYEILGFCDDDPKKKGKPLYGYSVLGKSEEVNQELPLKPYFLCAIGNNKHRMQMVERVMALGWQPATLVDPSVIVAKGVSVGVGSYVGAGSILSPDSQLGNFVIVNHGCSIGHNSRLEDFVQVSPGGRISGGCVLKRAATLGSNAAIAPKVLVGTFATVGACSFAMMDVPEGATVVGNPARVMFRSAVRD
jgi:sugar O-acyltransferase (sialic acid O-acetyltransferase NeuD family)